MRLATYRFTDGGVRIGVVEDGQVWDTGRAEPLAGLLGETQWERRGCEALDTARLLPPVAPRLLLGVGLNYRDHAAETGRALPDEPPVFAKVAALAPPYGTVPAWPGLDYEGELGVVIGRVCRGVSAAGARDCVAGWVVANDLTDRPLARPDTLALAKSGPGRGPIGPWLTTLDEVPDVAALWLRTWVNGELRQDGSTATMHRDPYELVAWISRHLALEPGDVVLTGSPGGSGVGFTPPRWLVPGDTVRVAIERLGAIATRVVQPASGEAS